jgi:hypothetical protein
MNRFGSGLLAILLFAFVQFAVQAEEKTVVGLIPKAAMPVKLDGKLDDWEAAFATPVHIGHPDFANRGAEFLYLWDDANLYIGLRCLDQHPAHVEGNNQIWNGDAVEFYLDTRRGDHLGAREFSAGSLHMFWTPFSKTEIKPRWAVRDLPAFKGLKLEGVEIAGEKTPWGWTAEFKLPWSNFPGFKPATGEIIGIDCELCSSDGGPRVDRTFVYSSPDNVATPSAFGRMKLVDNLQSADLKPLGRVLLPMSLTKSANYDWLYSTVCISSTIEKSVAKIEGKLFDRNGKLLNTTDGSRKPWGDSGFIIWTMGWELFNVPPEIYVIEVVALDKEGKPITSRKETFLHRNNGQTIGRSR